MAAELHPPRASPNQLPKPLPMNIGSRTASPATRWAFNPRLALPTTIAMVKFAAPEAPELGTTSDCKHQSAHNEHGHQVGHSTRRV